MKISFLVEDLKKDSYSKFSHFRELLFQLSNRFAYVTKETDKTILKNEEFLIDLYSSKLSPKKLLNEFNTCNLSLNKGVQTFYLKRFLDNFINFPINIKKENFVYTTKLPFQRFLHKNKTVLELTNLIPYLHPDFFKLNYNDLEVLDCLRRANYVIVNSDDMKKDLINKMFFNEEKITVIPRGLSNNFFLKNIDNTKLKELKTKYNLKNYILFSGKITRYKNLERLITAFIELKLKDLDLVIAGSFNTEYESYEHAFSYYKLVLNLSKISKNIKLLSYVNREEMPYIIKNSIAVVEPSYFNNFPDTVVEAIALGVPIIASNILEHRNFIKNEKFLFSPYSISEIKRCIKEVINENHSNKDAALDYCWDNVIVKYKDFFKSISV